MDDNKEAIKDITTPLDVGKSIKLNKEKVQKAATNLIYDFGFCVFVIIAGFFGMYLISQLLK